MTLADACSIWIPFKATARRRWEHNLPAFVIFHDATLRAIAASR
jgi:hypothetical protein